MTSPPPAAQTGTAAQASTAAQTGTATQSGTAARPLRADARRNRDAILAAARAAFEAEGVFASLDGIAIAAGVGNATLYRNFPTRNDLLAAVIEGSIREAVADSVELRESETPKDALAEWLFRVTWQLRIWHDLPACVVPASDTTEPAPVQAGCEPLVDQTAVFLAAAQEAGAARLDTSAAELFQLATSLSWGVDRYGDDAETARRRVSLATAGVFAA